MEAGKTLPFEQLHLEPLLRHEGGNGRAGGPSADHDYIRIRAHRYIIWPDYSPRLPCSEPAEARPPSWTKRSGPSNVIKTIWCRIAFVGTSSTPQLKRFAVYVDGLA